MLFKIIRIIVRGSRALGRLLAMLVPEPVVVTSGFQDDDYEMSQFARSGGGGWDDPEGFDLRHGIFSF